MSYITRLEIGECLNKDCCEHEVVVHFSHHRIPIKKTLKGADISYLILGTGDHIDDNLRHFVRNFSNISEQQVQLFFETYLQKELNFPAWTVPRLNSISRVWAEMVASLEENAEAPSKENEIPPETFDRIQLFRAKSSFIM